jgi:MoxR-like ATPase
MTSLVSLTQEQQATLAHLNQTFGAIVSRGQLMKHYEKKAKNGVLPRWLMADPSYKAGRGMYYTTAQNGGKVNAKMDVTKPFPKFKRKQAAGSVVIPEAVQRQETVIPQVASPPEFDTVENAQVIPIDRAHHAHKPLVQIGADTVESNALVPQPDPTFVPFGIYDDILKVIRKKVFFPIYITGLSGNGKSLAVAQACAVAGRELIRVQVTPETDEDDLIGGFRLVNGETVWFDGPVTLAAQRGAICLIDEIDYGTGKISCLQGIMEGNGIFLKKVNRFVPLAPGFNIIATANTKGRGSEEFGGKFINTQIMNEAFLERFGVTFEQEFPPIKAEIKMLEKNLFQYGLTDPLFAENLVNWADVTRKTFYAGATEDLITTRRLVHIIRAYAVYEDQKDAIQKCLARFSKDQSMGFYELYTKVAQDAADKLAAEEAKAAAEKAAAEAAAAAPMTPMTAPTSANDLASTGLFDLNGNITNPDVLTTFKNAVVNVTNFMPDPAIDPFSILIKDESVLGAFVSLMKAKGYFVA